MKKTAKKLLSTLLALIMLMSLAVPALAAGNSIDNATSISFDRTYSASILTEWHFYKFEISSSGIVEIKYNASQMETSRIYIYDANGQQIWNYIQSADSSTDKTAFTTKVGLISGKYYMSIDSRWDDAGNYSFSLSYENANESFKESLSNKNDNIENSSTLSFNKSYTGHFGAADKKDFYKFTKNNNSTITFNYNADNLFRTYFKIFNSNGEEVWSNSCLRNSTTQKSNFKTSVNLSSGTYYLLIEGTWEYSVSWGTYDFSLTTNGSTPTTTPDTDVDTDTDIDSTTNFDISAIFATILSFFEMVFNWIVGLFS